MGLAHIACVVNHSGMQLPKKQKNPVWQSEFIAQNALFPQGPHCGPPQSRSVSVPSQTPSEQVGVPQTPPTHGPSLAQSRRLLWHALPAGHGAHAGPPQSMSVSVPSFTPSWQVGATQT
jgi:hypothetical protein